MATSQRQKPVGRVAPLTWTTDPEEHRRLIAEGVDGLRARVTSLENANKTTTVTTATFTAGTEGIILADTDTVGGNITVNLPAANSVTTQYHVKNLGSAGSVIVDPDGSETIDGSLTATIGVQYDAINIASDGGAWWIL